MLWGARAKWRPSRRRNAYAGLAAVLGAGLAAGCASPSSEETDGSSGSVGAADTTESAASTSVDDTDVTSSGGGSDAVTSGIDTSETQTGTTAASGTTEGTGSPDFTGQELYFGRCLPCHGVMAEGGEFGYEMRHPARPYGLWVIRNGRPGDEFPLAEMLVYPEEMLSDEDVEKIFDWLDTFEQPTTGEGLYLDYCANCHGMDASGGVVQSDIRSTTLEQNIDIVRAGAGGTDYGSRLTYMPTWDEASLSDADLQAMIDYWSEVSPE